MDGVMELITGRERRRRWSATDKLRIVAECLSGIKASQRSRLGLGVDRLEWNVSLCAAPFHEVHHVDARDSSPA
jgi:hypothetical protein